MKTKLTRIHLGLGLDEVGVQFEVLDDATSERTSTQRAFIADPPAEIVGPMWGWARTALDARLADLPLEIPPDKITTALMKLRDAQREERMAREQKAVFEESARKAADAAVAAEAARVAAEKAKEKLAEDIVLQTATLTEVIGQRLNAQAEHDAAVTARAAALQEKVDIDTETARVRTELDQALAELARVRAEMVEAAAIAPPPGDAKP